MAFAGAAGAGASRACAGQRRRRRETAAAVPGWLQEAARAYRGALDAHAACAAHRCRSLNCRMDSSAADGEWWVACLCAGWCGVCRDWRPLFEKAARSRPDLRFAWVDVEDEAEAMGEVEIETFPTLLVAHRDQPLFLGPIPPTTSQLTRLVANLLAQPQPSPTLPPDAGPLLQRLKPQVFARTRF